jgi:two-component system phosphate regulon sensor histidine kinase PhoR
MRRKRFARLIVSYVASLVVTLALLVSWVVYVLRAGSRLNDLATRLGGEGGNSHVWVLVVGCVLFGLLIVGITLQLAQAIGERNYSKRQEEFVSNITHEMKSPLAAIKLHAQTLQQAGPAVVGPERSLRFILQHVDRMETLVDNVLESSRLSARKRRPETLVRLPDFFSTYFDEMRAPFEERVRLSVEIQTGASVSGTPDGLHRIMTNLLDNAVRFSAKGGEVRCRVTDERGHVVIEVADDGVGIPRQELPRVFDRFYQIGRELSDRRGGTGLGLAIVRGLVKEMKGTVEAHSQEGRPGTRFVVRLPMADGGAGA